MFITYGVFPDKVSAKESTLATSDRQTIIDLDGQGNLYLTVEQTRSLWYELGAVLQSEDATIAAKAHEAVLKAMTDA